MPEPEAPADVRPPLLWLLREPLVHFLVVGALLFAVAFLRGGHPRTSVPHEPDHRIVVDEVAVREVTEAFERRAGHSPNPEELERGIEDWIEHEILFREAMAMGLAEEDLTVRRRLAKKLAYAVQNREVLVDPGEAVLREYFEGHPERYIEPTKVSFEHVFVKGKHPGARQRVERLTFEIRNGSSPAGIGDRHPRGRSFRARALGDIRAMFGPAFTDGLEKLPLSRWHPRESDLGLHAVRVTEVKASRALTFEQARSRVYADWAREEASARTEEALGLLRAKYEVIRADP